MKIVGIVLLQLLLTSTLYQLPRHRHQESTNPVFFVLYLLCRFPCFDLTMPCTSHQKQSPTVSNVTFLGFPYDEINRRSTSTQALNAILGSSKSTVAVSRNDAGHPFHSDVISWLTKTSGGRIRYTIEPHGIPVRMTRLPHSKLRSRGPSSPEPKLTHP